MVFTPNYDQNQVIVDDSRIMICPVSKTSQL